MATGSMDSERFLREYELELVKEFEYDGKEAQWADSTSAHRFWGAEDATLELRDDDPEKGNTPGAAAAISPDERFLAVSTNAVIRIYDVSSRTMRSELIGHLSNVQDLFFSPVKIEQGTVSSTGSALTSVRHGEYLLFSEGAEVGGGDGQIIAWPLDADGRQLSRMMPFAIERMADQAVGAISGDLNEHHGLDDNDLQAIRAGFVETLKVADANNRVKNLFARNDVHFPGFGTFPVSHDGQALLYIVHGESTQSGMRPPEELPQIVVLDVATQTERCRLKGHEDAIMWAGWSADDRTIATACWDSYYKIWDAQTGECRHTIGPTGGQNWSGAFSPDGKHVLLSGGQPVKVAIYNVETGKEVTKLEREGLKLASWMRYFNWSSDGNSIALANGRGVILWEPFEEKVETVLQLKEDGTMLTRFNGFSIIKWVDRGKKLLLRDREGTIFVWDVQENVKWRFQRPQGRGMKIYSSDVFYAIGMRTIISLDGDGLVRFWKL